MATYAQQKTRVNAALRQARKAYRTADTLGELLERELDRLIKRKTLVGPASLKTLGNRYDAYRKWVDNELPQRIVDAIGISEDFG